MNDDLIDYGIHNEASDIRAHVSVANREVYVFRTQDGRDALTKYKPPERTAGQPGVEGVTAIGWLVRLGWIAGLRTLRYHSWPRWSEFLPTMSTTQKGALAVACVLDCIRIGRFPFWIDAKEDERRNVQVSGTDIIVFCKSRIQVKCDWFSGPCPKGTGNLFLQRAERNPLQRH